MSLFRQTIKKKNIVVLQNLQNEKYIMTNVRNDKIFRIYVQNIMKHVKTTIFFYLQSIIINLK